MFKTFITCESCCCCCWFCCCCSWWWWCYWTMCFCMWKSEMMRAKKASNKPTKRWKKKTKCILVLLCASVISSVSRSFVLSVRLSVDGHIDFFVRFPSNGLPHIYVKNTSFYCLPCSLIHSSVSFYSAAPGTLTCYIWTQSNILCAGAVTCTWFVKSLKWWLK